MTHNYWPVFTNIRDLLNAGGKHHVCLCAAFLFYSMLYFVPIRPTFVGFQGLSTGRGLQLHTNTACVVCKPPADVGKLCTSEPPPTPP